MHVLSIVSCICNKFDYSNGLTNIYFRRVRCDRGSGMPPVYINVNMKTGETANHWIDALQAAWSGVQVIYGIYFQLNIDEPRHEIPNNLVCTTSKASDQPAHTRSLIRAFASRLNIPLVLSY